MLLTHPCDLRTFFASLALIVDHSGRTNDLDGSQGGANRITQNKLQFGRVKKDHARSG